MPAVVPTRRVELAVSWPVMLRLLENVDDAEEMSPFKAYNIPVEVTLPNVFREPEVETSPVDITPNKSPLPTVRV